MAAPEQLISQVIARGQPPYLVSKVLPSNASARGIARACEASLQRLGVRTLDLYLLHWRGGSDLAEVVAAFETLRDAGKIRDWGVSISMSTTCRSSGRSMAGSTAW